MIGAQTVPRSRVYHRCFSRERIAGRIGQSFDNAAAAIRPALDQFEILPKLGLVHRAFETDVGFMDD